MTPLYLSDEEWMRRAISLSGLCPPSPGAYSVGAVLVDGSGMELAYGYSREGDPSVHAEESALAKLAPGDGRLSGATLYSTLEPCSQRRSRPDPCARLVIAAGVRRVVIAWRELALFVAACTGVAELRAAGIEVVELARLAGEARKANAHLWRAGPGS
ncbi:deaminase [Streptomyces sp. NPDC059389]|uniref:deaminase n=1 Tax=Streptomyces sp. NPDC059389 TaxID=3346818 RepID=UPI0036A72191